MADEREKVLKQNDEPDVEAHKVLKAADEKAPAEADAEAPDVEAHKLLHKTLK
jgi:hypothetical protein